MSQVFDAIVVGAGNGGMTGALTLCKAGKKVLLLEKHNVPGGCATSFKRGRFEFEVALHQLYGIGETPTKSKGPLREMFEEFGIWDKLTFVPQKDAFRLAFRNFGEITLPNTRESFVQELKDFFGPESAAIDEYQSLVDRVAVEFDDLYFKLADGLPVNEENYPYIFKYGGITGKEMLDKYFENPMLKGVYQCLYGYLGIPIERVPFAVLAALYVRDGGTWNVNGGSQAMSNALVNTFMDSGGTLKLNTKVERIIVEDNAVKGVITADGETYLAPVVLCNANRINVYVDMIDNRLVPEEVYADLRVSSPGQSIFGLFIALDCPPEEVGIENGTSFLMPPPGGPPSRYDVNLRQLDYVATEYFTCYNIDDPDYSPKGTTVLTLLAGKTPDTWVAMAPEKYHEAKFDYAEKMLDYFEQYYPGVREHIEETEVCTPLTFMNYIGSPNGAIYGVDCHMKDLIATKLDPRSPFKGLYFCGASFLFGGFHTTLLSGRTAAKVILRDIENGVVPFDHDYTGMTGLEKILSSLEAGRVYNLDHRINKGRIKNVVDLYHPDRIDFRVTEIRSETDTAKTLRLTPLGGYVPPFMPGQYINVNVEVGGVCTSRAYSISSSCAERGYYEITVRRSAAGFVSDYLLDKVRVGDTLAASGPAGQFYRFPAVHGKKLCFIAGGSGITPFMSMVQSDYDRLVDDKEIVLIYGCAREDDIIFGDRLRALEAKMPGLRIVPVISEPTPECRERSGFITKELIADMLGDVNEYTFFLCGPQAMYDFVEPELDKLGIRRRRIRREVQTAPANPSKCPGWPEGVSESDVFNVTLPDGSGFRARAGETLISSIEKADLTIRSMCRSGECSYCRSRLLSGRVFHPGTANLRKSDMQWGYIHPCVTYPVSDITLFIP